MATSKIVEDYADIIQSYNPSANVTRNVLTRYERTKIIGMRLEQLARGAPPYVEPPERADLRSIVEKEMQERKIPFMIARTLPNGKKEYWRLDDMII